MNDAIKVAITKIRTLARKIFLLPVTTQHVTGIRSDATYSRYPLLSPQLARYILAIRA